MRPAVTEPMATVIPIDGVALRDSESPGTVTTSLRELLLAGERFRHLVAARLRLGVTDATALNCLGARGPMTAGELAEALSLTPGTITALLDRLATAGLARRATDPNDRRRVVVALTPDGEVAAAVTEDRLRAAVESVSSGLPHGTTASLAQLADALRCDLSGR
jgi:DNA-binding MarR family transcriptional regulator